MPHDYDLPGYIVRRATTDDIPTLVRFREAMFRSLGVNHPDHDAFNRDSSVHLRGQMEAGRLAAWLAETADGESVACGAVCFYELTPKPWNPDGRYAYLNSFYTDSDHRRRGLAERLMTTAIEYVQQCGIQLLVLHASEAGHNIYRRLGFEDSNVMELQLDRGDEETEGGMGKPCC